MSKISIFVCMPGNKECARVDSQIYVPVYGGNALQRGKDSGIAGDDTGDNISAKNPGYCEETVLYWAWKNRRADYYGFCHYRRYFDFAEEKHEKDCYGNIIEKYINEESVSKYGLKSERLNAIIENADIVVTDLLDVSQMPEKYKNLYEHYCKASDQLHGEDLITAGEIIKLLYPDYYDTFMQYIYGSKGYFCNMFIMPGKLLDEYCKWLFSILSEFEKRTDMKRYSVEGLRTPGHIAERLLGVFINQKKKENPDFRIKEVPRVLFENPEKQELIRPVFKENSVPVVFAANNKFSAPLAAALQSLAETASPKRNYDIVVLESDISAANKALLQAVLSDCRNTRLRFFNVDYIIDGHQLISHGHISKETFFRFLIQEVMPEYEKAIYLDGDIIIRHDVAELFDTDLGDCCLGAVLDLDFISCVNGYDKSRMGYARDRLKLADPYSYFQAGVLSLNLKKMRSMYTMQEWIAFGSEDYIYADQDILNRYCQGHVLYLNQKWNLLFDHDYRRVEEVFRYAPAEMRRTYNIAAEDPYIIHYAGDIKPWNILPTDHYEDFWKAARETPFYELLLYDLTRITVHPQDMRPLYRVIADKILPLGSRRREVLKIMLGRKRK